MARTLSDATHLSFKWTSLIVGGMFNETWNPFKELQAFKIDHSFMASSYVVQLKSLQNKIANTSVIPAHLVERTLVQALNRGGIQLLSLLFRHLLIYEQVSPDVAREISNTLKNASVSFFTLVEELNRRFGQWQDLLILLKFMVNEVVLIMSCMTGTGACCFSSDAISLWKQYGMKNMNHM